MRLIGRKILCTADGRTCGLAIATHRSILRLRFPGLVSQETLIPCSANVDLNRKGQTMCDDPALQTHGIWLWCAVFHSGNQYEITPGKVQAIRDQHNGFVG